MSVDACLRAYKKMAEKAFTPKWAIIPARPGGAFSAKALEEAVKEVIKDQCENEHCKLNGCDHDGKLFRDQECCKT